MKTIAATLTALALVVPATAQADDFPANEDPHCTYDVPSKMRLGPCCGREFP